MGFAVHVVSATLFRSVFCALCFIIYVFSPITVLPWYWGMVRQYVSILFYSLAWRHVIYVIVSYSICVWETVYVFPCLRPRHVSLSYLAFAVGYYSSRYYPVVRTGCEVNLLLRGFSTLCLVSLWVYFPRSPMFSSDTRSRFDTRIDIYLGVLGYG